MSRKYFGTDGIRGHVGHHPMTVDFALRLASAAARVLAPDGGTVLVGKDTRLSGYMFESALEAGFVAAGVDVMLMGPLPTPGIAYLTKRFECDFGVVISASHNLYEDNGIKFFDANGGKLSDEIEARDRKSSGRAAGDAQCQASWAARPAWTSRACTTRSSARRPCPGLDLTGLQDRHRLRERRGLQGGPAHPGRPGRGDRADRLLTERPQHQSELRFDVARTAATHGTWRTRAGRHRARWRWRSSGDGRSPGSHRGRRSVALHHRACPTRAEGAAGARRRNGHEQPGPRACAREGGHRVPARQGRRSLCDGTAQGNGRCARRRNFRAPAVPGSHDDGRCPDQRAAGPRDHEATGRSLAELAAPMPKYPQVLENVRMARKIDMAASPAIQEAVSHAERKLGKTAESCCGRPVPSPSSGHGGRARREAGAGARQNSRLVHRCGGCGREQSRYRRRRACLKSEPSHRVRVSARRLSSRFDFPRGRH